MYSWISFTVSHRSVSGAEFSILGLQVVHTVTETGKQVDPAVGIFGECHGPFGLSLMGTIPQNAGAYRLVMAHRQYAPYVTPVRELQPSFIRIIGP
ncbi:hypothetical protein GCM10010412_041510 [Nonomuraea recticatena]|uniref:Uncharacterized protein n=1 Tax=Nonomuraea recticatena TaxID=46178 RepID=A0ABP6ECU5_9ACTN